MAHHNGANQLLAHAHHMQITLAISHDTCWDSTAVTVALQGIFLVFLILLFFHECEGNVTHHVELFKPRGFPWFPDRNTKIDISVYSLLIYRICSNQIQNPCEKKNVFLDQCFCLVWSWIILKLCFPGLKMYWNLKKFVNLFNKYMFCFKNS